ncbi:hypothetical protein V1478_014117, partial [Vespula squamosa]
VHNPVSQRCGTSELGKQLALQGLQTLLFCVNNDEIIPDAKCRLCRKTFSGGCRRDRRRGKRRRDLASYLTSFSHRHLCGLETAVRSDLR